MKAKTKCGISQLVQQIGTTKFLVCIVRLYYQNHQYLNQIGKSRFNQSIVNSLLEYFRRKISEKYKTKKQVFFLKLQSLQSQPLILNMAYMRYRN